ncbi:hypothetical protein BKA70DRAFT_1104328 [Coprinopsis sp. MPI-PUGE-AT-0042]|nr:hypothetical protein BKA70DRAFT_1104328 [Coprinopsis sp. MPI-PUGE-AT-0042]
MSAAESHSAPPHDSGLRSYSLFSASVHLLDAVPDADLQALAYYLSSHARAAGSRYIQLEPELLPDVACQFLRYLFGEVAWFTMFVGFIRYRLGNQLDMPDCMNDLGRLMLRERTHLDVDLIAAACLHGSAKPDRVLVRYNFNWWTTFDITLNWDGTIDTIIKTFQLQRHQMYPEPVPPIPTIHLSDLADHEMARCANSIQQTKATLEADTRSTLNEIAYTMNLIRRFESLLKATETEEKEKWKMVKKIGLTAKGLSEEEAEKLLESENLRF